ncbi:MAG: flagellar biosynthetic protein FliQ [Planctomycetes bacterium]|nr:flagellar biosynthetic protein FliQ [Planctomycetota bacterium]
MTDQLQQAVDVTNSCFEVAFQIALPLLIVTLIVGLAISIFQTATSVQEQTLSFVPKIIAVGVLIVILFPWMSRTLIEYTTVLWRDVMPGFMAGG